MTDFAYQLYSSRNFPPLGDTLAMLAELGYGAVEGFGGLYGDEAGVAALEAGLKDSGLAMPTAHFSLDMVESGAWRDIAKRLGVETVIVPYIAEPDRPTDTAGWEAFAARLAEAGKPVQDAGLGYGWHNHDFEFTADGPHPLDLILGASDGMLLEFDVAWAVVAGQDPADWIARYGPRIVAAHLKDLAPKGENRDEDGWADLGHGTIAWPEIFAQLQAAGTRHFIMEHDNPSDHHRFASRALAAARAF